MKKGIMFLTLCMLSGCATGLPEFHYDEVSPKVIDNTEKIFVGIPGTLSMEGSAARYNKDWLITVSHNYLIKPNMIRHPKCDIALIKDSGENTVKIGNVFQGQKTFMLGYPLLMPLVVNEGTYLEEIKGADGCIYSAVDGTMITGMSGGGVYNEKNELIGVNVGFAKMLRDGKVIKDKVAIIAPIKRFEKWINKVTHEKKIADVNNKKDVVY